MSRNRNEIVTGLAMRPCLGPCGKKWLTTAAIRTCPKCRSLLAGSSRKGGRSFSVQHVGYKLVMIPQ